ncbi:MAG: hypothetical protein IKU62_08385 [Ruminiclostridium sp.]|nr:hypothetical protein [Ruminiclostridium sp.]
MVFRLAVGGDLPNDPKIIQRLSEELAKLRTSLQPGEDIGLEALIFPTCTGDLWQEQLKLAGFSLRQFPDTGFSAQADLLLAVWNEDTKETVWPLIQAAHQNNTPCLWISSKTGMLYWSERPGFYYGDPEPGKLQALCAALQEPGLIPEDVSAGKIPFLSLGETLRRHFLERYSGSSKHVWDGDTDALLKEDFDFSREVPAGTSLRKHLLAQFKRFDDAAGQLNARYQSVLYWRSILPFITTLFLALGFYAESVLGVISLPVPLWAVLAGAGFLIHGLINLYVYILSRSNTIDQWHKGFLNSRQTAEILRVLLHFAPYGIHLDLRKLCGGNQKVYLTIRRIMDTQAYPAQNLSPQTKQQMLLHIQEMIEDQADYHSRSILRYEKVDRHLSNWHRWIFAVGFGAVLLRALFQFVVVFFPIGAGMLGGVELSRFAGSFANMVALLLPAWASYFSTKQTLGNFKYNLENHKRMYDRLTKLLQQIRSLQTSHQDLPSETLLDLGEMLAETMLLEDTAAWHHQYMGSTVTHL